MSIDYDTEYQLCMNATDVGSAGCNEFARCTVQQGPEVINFCAVNNQDGSMRCQSITDTAATEAYCYSLITNTKPPPVDLPPEEPPVIS